MSLHFNPALDDEDRRWLASEAHRIAYQKSPDSRTAAEQEMAEDYAGVLCRNEEQPMTGIMSLYMLLKADLDTYDTTTDEYTSYSSDSQTREWPEIVAMLQRQGELSPAATDMAPESVIHQFNNVNGGELLIVEVRI